MTRRRRVVDFELPTEEGLVHYGVCTPRGKAPGCNASIIIAKVLKANGERVWMPLDPSTRVELFDGVVRMESHWSRCPHAAAHRLESLKRKVRDR